MEKENNDKQTQRETKSNRPSLKSILGGDILAEISFAAKPSYWFYW